MGRRAVIPEYFGGYIRLADKDRRPVDNTISKWVYRHSAQSCCPWNEKFATELKEPAFRPREFLANKDARTLACDLLAMEQDEFSVAFRKSPMKRAKLAGLQRNARVVLSNSDRQSWPANDPTGGVMELRPGPPSADNAHPHHALPSSSRSRATVRTSPKRRNVSSSSGIATGGFVNAAAWSMMHCTTAPGARSIESNTNSSGCFGSMS